MQIISFCLLSAQILLPLKAKPMATSHPKPLLISLAGSNFCLPRAPLNCVYTNKVVIHTDKFAYLIIIYGHFILPTKL